jgi:hypothetical protein
MCPSFGRCATVGKASPECHVGNCLKSFGGGCGVALQDSITALSVLLASAFGVKAMVGVALVPLFRQCQRGVLGTSLSACCANFALRGFLEVRSSPKSLGSWTKA